MIKRVARWWTGRPFHRIKYHSAEGVETLRFSDDEWSFLLLTMGNLGCTTVPEAVMRAVHLSKAEDEPVVLEAKEPSTGFYL